MRISCLLVALLCLALAPARAQTGQPNHIRAELVAESLSPAPGKRTMLALSFTPQPGWHGYWKNPGDAGIDARLEWRLPKGVKLGAPRYPVPEKLMIFGLMNHVFNGPHALLIPLELDASVPSGTVLPIRLGAQWLACTDKICVPESAEIQLDLRAGEGNIAPSARARFDGWRAKLPRPLGAPARFQVEAGELRIAIPLPRQVDAKDAWFFAETENAIAYAAPQRVERQGDLLLIAAKPAGGPGLRALRGVLAIDKQGGFEIEARPGSVPNVASAIRAPPLWLALGGALLGGLLLNLMPCVFPVVSLKALGLARAGESASAARTEATAYASGAVLACLLLGAVLLGLRAGGAAVGWAFQLQDPRMILFLLLLTGAIALNLAGLFKLQGFGGGQQLVGKGGASGAFWTGALAAFVATPCTGPFMAAALGAALVLPAAQAMAIFGGLGLGLALPFLLIGFVPALRGRLPRPGSWMARFQRWLSLPMFATAVALAWLLSRQAGSSGLLLGVAALVATGGTLWIVRRARPAGLGFAALLAGLATFSLALSPLLANPAGRNSAIRIEGALPFSEARLQALRAAGKPVFLYFTADWCLTCKVNEANAIAAQNVRAHFRARAIAVMAGDWTTGDPAITRFLEAHGRSGVPFYLFYPAGSAGPKELPQLLTPAMLTAL